MSLVYLDLDRTIYKTRELETVWDYLAEHFPQAAGAYEHREDFFHEVGDSYYYDMSAHVASLGLEPQDVYKTVVGSELADGRCEYEGAKALIETLRARGYEVKVLTFGTDETQRFKASLCPSLRDVEVLTTLRSKTDVLEELEQECWLVDDRPLGDELPGNVSFIQVCFDGQAAPPDAMWPVFYSLKDVQEFFKGID